MPSPVENGIPLQGTWTEAFKEVDLLDIHRPYPVPLPAGIKDFRIKEWESFIIQNEHFCLMAKLSNFKFFRSAHLIMYNKETKEKLSYRKIIPGGCWKLPRGLNNSTVDSRSYGFFFRIHSWLDTGTIQLEINIRHSLLQPAFAAHATFDFAAGMTVPMAVSLLFQGHRNMYAYKALTAVSGDLVSGGQHFHIEPEKTLGLFCDCKGYYPYIMRSTWCTGLDFDGMGRRIGFALGENQAREPYKNNENALWINGQLTPLPPVKITSSGGPESEWIIQDMEGMVDLVFTPRVNERYIKDIIFVKSDYEYPMGYFNGQLVGADGEELPVHNVWGIAEKLYLRV